MGSGGAAGSAARDTGVAGGSAGAAGGSAGAAGGGAGAPPGYEWLSGSKGWSPAEAVDASCRPDLAELSTFAWPGHDWKACGPGCLTAPAVPGGAKTYALEYGSGLRRRGSVATLSMTANVLLSPTVKLALALELPSGDVIAAARKVAPTGTPPCWVEIASRYSPHLFMVARGPGQGVVHDYGLLDVATGAVSWAEPPVTSNILDLDFAGGWGGVETFASLRVTLDPASSELTTVATGSWLSSPAIVGDTVILADWRAGGGAILAWNEALGARELATGSWNPAFVVASPERIVWLAVTGANPGDGLYDTATLMWSPFAEQPAGIVVNPGVALPAKHYPLLGLATSKDTAAMVSCETMPADCRLLVIQLDAGDIWEVRLGDLAWLLGMTEDEIIVGLRTDSTDVSSFQQLYRYDFGRIAEYGTKL